MSFDYPFNPSVKANDCCACCVHGGGGSICPWANSGKPVKGWSAIPTVIKTNNKTAPVTRSYKILWCPIWEEGDILEGRETKPTMPKDS